MAKRTCEIDGCANVGKIVRGMCAKHYTRWKRYGDPHDHGSVIVGDDLARFRSKVEERDGCCLWVGHTFNNGYGMFGVGNDPHRNVLAHRWAYEQWVGPIPDGADIDHTCHNGSGCEAVYDCMHRRCVNPAHLEAVDHRTNLRRGSGLIGQNVLKTHCPQGHPYDEVNTRVYRTSRRCKQCDADAKRRKRAAA